MVSAEIVSDVWQPEGHAPRIEYSLAVMESLCMDATHGFNRLAHGGLEIGGVLFGCRDSDSIKILGYRQLECEYAFGPSFTLSGKDGQALEALLASADKDRDLAGMQALGWYHSHTRSEISLSEKDLELFRRYFPQPWQIALVLRPHRFDPVRAGFFFRQPDGSIRAQSTLREFVVHPAGSKADARVEIESEPVNRDPREAKPPVLEPAPPLVPKKNETKKKQPKPAAWHRVTWNKRKWIWRGAGAVLISAAALYWIGYARRAEGLSLRALDIGGQLRIEWRSADHAIQGSTGGTLDIIDGPHRVQNELSPEQLRAGSVTYMRNTGDVFVRLRVRGADQTTYTETARFLGSPVPNRTNPSAAGRLTDTETEPQRIVSAPAPSRDQMGSVDVVEERRLPIKRDILAQQIPPEAPRAATNPARHRMTAPANAARSVESLPMNIPPAPSGIMPNPPPLISQTIPRLPAPEIPKPAHRGPSAGRIIWTGKLARHGIVQIRGTRASQGYITGALPGVPVRVQVFPAELTAGGLRIFTANSKSTAATEAPGAENGWNRTTYVWNPGQAQTISVIEPPGPGNDWSALTLRAEKGEHSIIVLRWQLATSGISVQSMGGR